MSTSPDVRSPLVQFLDSFLQERNIRWILVAGLAILFGSSVMLVTMHWHDTGPVWKYLVFLGYTSVAFVCGRYVCPRLGLDRTANCVLSLVSLLLPVTFVAWRWSWYDAGDATLLKLPSFGLLAVNLAIAGFAAREIFRRLLRDEQTTLTISYLTLAVAGALLPACPAGLLLPASVLLWLVFTAGAVKVNRHVFWLSELMRWPRVFAFFPVLLLAAQFVGLLALAVAPHVSLAWLGSVVVLASVTILLTADAVARVYEQRTGGFVWPWPISIAVPMLSGLIVCLGGVGLAATGVFSGTNGRPLVLAAALAAIVMERVARRTGHSVFIYAMLILVTVSYNFLPSFALDTARQVVSQSAHLVHEQRLPLAFYGLTYLPLLGGLLGVAAFARRRNDTLLAEPIGRFAMLLGTVLLAAGATHAKALAPVGLAMTTVFVANERIFRSPVAVIGTIVAWLAACVGVVPFLSTVLDYEVPVASYFLVLAAGAAALMIAGAVPRRTIAHELPMFDAASLLVALGLALVFPVFAFMAAEATTAHGYLLFGPPNVIAKCFTWGAGVAVALLLVAHSLRWKTVTVSTVTVLFGHALSALVLLENCQSADQLLACSTLWLVGQAVGARLLRRLPAGNPLTLFRAPLEQVLTVELSALLSLAWLPKYALSLHGAVSWSGGPLVWVAATAIIVWAFAQAVQFRHWFTALLGSLGVVGLACTVFMYIAGPVHEAWLPVVCAALAIVALPIVEILRAKERRTSAAGHEEAITAARAIEAPLVSLAIVIFVSATFLALVSYSSPALVGGMLAIAGLSWFAIRSPQPAVLTSAAALVTWQIVALPLQALQSQDSLLHLSPVDLPVICFPIGLLAALALALWQCVHTRSNDDNVLALIALQRLGLGMLTVGVAICAGAILAPTTGQVVCVVAGVSSLCLAQMYLAWRDQGQPHVWLAAGLVGLAIAYLVRWKIIVIGGQFTMFLLLSAGVVLWLTGRVLQGRGRANVFAQPCMQLGFWLPLGNLAVATVRHLSPYQPDWLGANSLALFMTAGFYCWRGIDESRPKLIVLAAAVVNAGLLFAWRELQITNPQFYLIPLGATIVLVAELLRRELPANARNPLRYVGAVTVLVSPTFDMLDGTWGPFVTLMVASVLVLLVAIGLRVRALMYTATGFLVVDLLGMVVRGCCDHPQLLWLAGLLIGTSVVVVGAVCERQRETILSRVRQLSAVLESWE